MNIAIIKYNAGNTQSVIYALNRLGIEPTVTDDAEVISKADKVIFPGVGEASTAMKFLQNGNLDRLLPSLKQPVLGICLGLQLMCSHSEENNTAGLNIFPVRVRRFEAKDKIPHMGWNTIATLKSPLFTSLVEPGYVYFVHSYYAEINEYTAAVTDYILPFSSALHRDNFYAVQFHTEKSSKPGALILKNFIDL